MEAVKQTRIVMKSSVNQVEVYETTVYGTVTKKDGSIYIRYKEQMPFGEVSNTVKYKGEEVIVLRSGAVQVRQVFKVGETNESIITGATGAMNMVVNTKMLQFDVDIEARTYTLDMKYHLTLQYESIGDVHISLTAIEADGVDD